MRDQSGFSLVELLVIIGLIGLLTAIAFPSFQTWRERAGYVDAAQQLMGHLRHARAMAIANNREVKVQVDLTLKNFDDPPVGGIYSWDWGSSSWTQDLAFTLKNVGVLSGNSDSDNDGSYADEACNGAGTTKEMIFQPNGAMKNASTFRYLCVMDSQGTARKYIGVYSMASGLARIE